MSERRIRPVPLTAERFAPYGDVIEASRRATAGMNDARFERFDDLCQLDAGGGRLAVSLVCARVPSALPYRVDFVERHPLGTQAFVPLSPCRMIVMVAPAGESVSSDELVAFESNGRQGINYHRGVWHMPLIAFDADQRFLLIDRAAGEPNCDIHTLDEPLLLVDA